MSFDEQNNLPYKPCPFCSAPLTPNGDCSQRATCSGKTVYDNGYRNPMPLEEYPNDEEE